MLQALDELPKDWSWKKHGLHAMRHVETQGGCGSCWAFSASTLLRAHTELYRGGDRKFSQQQILSCTRNPQHCGGNGGCSGATVELALDYVHRRGCSTGDSMPYRGNDRNCPESMSDSGGSARRPAAFLSLGGARGSETGGESFGMTGYTRLPENELAPVLLALYQRGPVGVSVAAGTSWNFYGKGILYACSKDAVINHAVVLVGYGEDNGKLYWQLQNSWGRKWGEDGFLRLRRHSHVEESKYCGNDRSPQQGSGCKGGPKIVTVCGTCGILNDAVVPNFRQGEAGWWSLMDQSGANATSRMVVADGSVSAF
jgi:cathepsin L